MKSVFRYRTMKPDNGHFQFNLHGGASVLSFTEHWHSEKGWELFLDALEDSDQPKESRFFFLCNAGDALDFLGDYPDAYYCGNHDAKSYVSYVFETTHLSETERVQGHILPARYKRMKPTWEEMSTTDRTYERQRIERQREGRGLLQ